MLAEDKASPEADVLDPPADTLPEPLLYPDEVDDDLLDTLLLACDPEDALE